MLHLKEIVFLILFVAGIALFVSAQNSCRFTNCYDSSGNPLPCRPPTFKMASTKNITSSNTCGRPRAQYCELPGGETCHYCDADSNVTSERHPASNMVDDDPYKTWWQSQNWWQTNQIGLSSSKNPLRVNIILSFGKSYHLSGYVRVRFYNIRPKAMCIDKSSDFGRTWQTLQCYSRKCSRDYKEFKEAQVRGFKSIPGNISQVFCTDDYSSENPLSLGVVEFRTYNRYEICNFFKTSVQDYLEVTNIRIRLEKPATDGREIFSQHEKTLNKFFYAISNINVTGRCSCNGHAADCTGRGVPLMDRYCLCQHNTTGRDCEKCKPLYNNRPWMRANQTNANECKECNCNNHGSSCLYNQTLGYGVCQGCKHNTQGDQCQNCVVKFYRDLTKPLHHANACIACDCFPDGITNNGTCLSRATETEVIGQCQCKPKVFGRRCDQCQPGHWGFTLAPKGECLACNCTVAGTSNGSGDCNQLTGQCNCKPSIQGRLCDECKDGYHSFPSNFSQECQRCTCDLGGGLPVCNKTTGACTCRGGVVQHDCNGALEGTFYPSLDYLLFQAEFIPNNLTTLTPATGYGSEFTGRGYVVLISGREFTFPDVKVKKSYDYYLVLRYTTSKECNDGTGVKISITAHGLSTSWQTPFETVALGAGQALVLVIPESLKAEQNYNFTVTYIGSDHCGLYLDSLVLVPVVNDTRVFKLSGPEIPSVLQECVNSRVAMSRINTEDSRCQQLVFSASTEIYNGTLPCECNREGSTSPDQCHAYGGQCACKPGVGGRTCDICRPGYYGFSNVGCAKCSCSPSGSSNPVCGNSNGKCECKANVEGHNCDTCKPGTFNLDATCPRGCQPCFGYGHASNCTSAPGFIAINITTDFATGLSGWVVVDGSGNPVLNVTTVTGYSTQVRPRESSHSELYIAAPQEFLGNKLYSYKQKLFISMEVSDSGSIRVRRSTPSNLGKITVILKSDVTMATLQADISTGHVVLDELHTNESFTAFEFQSLLTNLTAIWVDALYHPYPDGAVEFKEITLESARANSSAANSEMVSFVEKAVCHGNYTGLSCEHCAQGYTREMVRSSAFGRCVLCSCSNRSRECHPDTGLCINCQVGTYGDYCELCTNNVQEPDCTRCKPDYWGLSRDGCTPCDCNVRGTSDGNSTTCDQLTGQCQCNAVLNIGGRLCDRCKENAYNTSDSLFSCKECPQCYTYIQTDVHRLRAQVTQLQALSDSLHRLPVIQHVKPFALRLNESSQEVSALATRSLSAAVTVRELEEKFATLQQDILGVYNLTHYVLEPRVNGTLKRSHEIEAEQRQINESIHITRALVRQGYSTLESSINSKIQQLERHSISLNGQAAELANLTEIAEQLMNSTMNSNRSIHARVESALNTAAAAAISARAVNSSATELNTLLPGILANATRAKELLNIGEERLKMALDVLTEAQALATLANKPNTNNTQLLLEVSSQAGVLLHNGMAYTAQVHGLINSSLSIIAQVHSAIQRARVLDTTVRNLELNATSIKTGLETSLSESDDAIARGARVYNEAREMWNLLKNFSGAATQAQARANQSLAQARVIENLSQQCISNVSEVNTSTHAAVVLARSAVEQGRGVLVHAQQEKQVINNTLSRAHDLLASTLSAEEIIANQTVREFLRREIKPLQDVCQNLSSAASNASKKANNTFTRAYKAQETADKLLKRAQVLQNESNSLPQITEHRVPGVMTEIARVRDLYSKQNVTGRISELKRAIQEDREVILVKRKRIDKLKAWVARMRRQVQSFGRAVSTCGDHP